MSASKASQPGASSAGSRSLVLAALRDARKVFLYIGLFSIFINLLMLVGPIYMLQVYDRVLTSGSIPTLVYLTVVAAFLILIGSLLDFSRSRLLVRLSGMLDGHLGEPVFERMVMQRAGATGSEANALRDVDHFRNFLTGPGVLPFFDAPWVPVFIAAVFMLHPWLGLIALVGAILLFLLAWSGEWVTRGLLIEAGEASRNAQALAEDTMRNAEAVKAMWMLPGLSRIWNAPHSEALGLQTLASDRSSWLNAATKFLRPFLQVAILGAGAFLALTGSITPGAMVAASIIMSRALAPVEMTIQHWRGFVQARAAYARLAAFLELEKDKTEATTRLPAPNGALSVERLFAAPPGAGTPVIKGISFSVEPGQGIGLIGPSGAGKSTLVRALLGLWQPLQGTVRIDGAELGQWRREDLGPFLGYLPQQIELLNGTVAQNIARFRDSDPEDIIAAAQMAGVHELILRMPDGYDTKLGHNGFLLSGGQKQRVALARAVFGDARIVILDEPNSNLDADGEQALQRALAALKAAGSTLVIVAQKPSILAVVDKIIVLRNGQIEEIGARDEILAKVTRPTVVGRSAENNGPSGREVVS